ncbi:hypothetical protein D3C74_357330 [compost metagenome]
MPNPRVTGIPRRVDSIHITGFWRNDTVGCHQNRAVESGEFLRLFPPGVAVIANKVAVFLESRIIMGGQHLAVGVDVDAGSFGLYQQLF